MKTFQLKFKTLAFLLLFSFIFTGCKNNSKNGNKKEAYAQIQLDDGSTIDFKPSMFMGGANSSTTVGANMSDLNSTIMLSIRRPDDKPIKEGKVYDGRSAQISISNTQDGPLDEMYRSYHFKSEDGEEGEAKITVTALGENHSEGTFKGTLYSKSHKKIVVEGKFTNEKK